MVGLHLVKYCGTSHALELSAALSHFLRSQYYFGFAVKWLVAGVYTSSFTIFIRNSTNVKY